MFGKLSKSKKFYLMLSAFIIGVAMGSFKIQLLFLAVALSILTIILFILKGRIIVILIIFAIVAGFFWLQRSVPEKNIENIHFFNEEKVIVEGFISEEVDLRSDHQKLAFKTEKIKFEDSWRQIKGLVLVKTELYPYYEYGQILKIECLLRQPGKIDDFDYEKYLARYNIYSTCYNSKIAILEGEKGSFLKKYLLKSKKYFLNKINRILPEPHASFLAGLLLGVRKGIPKEIMEAFNRTGVTHIIAVSGYNITIVAVALMNFFKAISISRKKSFYFAVLGIIAFVFLCGASAAVVRAAIMGIIVLVANQVGRKTNTLYILILAVFIMVMINPKILIFDMGFQLSFLATIGLIYLSKPIEKFFKFMPETLGLRENFSTTMAAILTTSPLIMYNFSRISLVAPVANILILSAIPIAMFVGFIGILLAIFSVYIGQIFSWITWLILEYIIQVVKILAELDWASINLGFGLRWVIFCYVLIFILLYFCNNLKIVRPGQYFRSDNL